MLQVSPNAEPSVIKAAYTRLALTYHPDVAKDPAMQARMADINEAYAVLSDPLRRAEYDRVFKDRYQPPVSEVAEPSEEEIVLGLMRLAAEKAAQGKSKSQVADELTREGVPYDVAAEIADRVFTYRTEFKRKEGTTAIGCGLLMLIVGGLVTGISYWAASGPGGGVYIVTMGLFIVGALALLRGLYKWFTS